MTPPRVLHYYKTIKSILFFGSVGKDRTPQINDKNKEMKLIVCRECQDVVRLIQGEKRTCKCGKVGGKYLDELNAVYFGDMAVPIGFANNSLAMAIRNQPKQGMGQDFDAFVIPKVCNTFTLVEESECL